MGERVRFAVDGDGGGERQTRAADMEIINVEAAAESDRRAADGDIVGSVVFVFVDEGVAAQFEVGGIGIVGEG